MSEVSFSFDDKLYKGHHGEPMAAALLRSGMLSRTDASLATLKSPKDRDALAPNTFTAPGKR